MKYSSQLKSILKESGSSQTQVAQWLDVSHPTLNSWINERSQPRNKMLARIERLYIDVIGSLTVDDSELSKTVQKAQSLRVSVKKIIKKEDALSKLLLLLTYHSNTIEGSTMTLSDVKNVIFEDKTLTNRTAVEQAEARNHQAVLKWLLQLLAEKQDSLVIDERLILEIHLRLMNGIIADAGQYRRHSVRITGSHVPVTNWQIIPEKVSMLLEQMTDTDESNIVENLSRTHATFEQIHPFSDGNGRTGRLLMLIQALRAGFIPPLVAKERKHAYYRYLELAQINYTYRPLELFIAQSMIYADAEVLK